MKKLQANDLDTYIYVRIPKTIKKRIQNIAKKEGSNMTIWVRQNLIRQLENSETIGETK